MSKKNDDGTGLLLLEMTIPEKRIAQLICCAFESGLCANWATRVTTILPVKAKDCRPILDGKEKRGGRFWPEIDGPLCGGEVRFAVEDYEEPRMLRRESIRSGLRVMAERYGRHFGDFLAGREDAITGDVFLQCSLLGEVVFG